MLPFRCLHRPPALSLSNWAEDYVEDGPIHRPWPFNHVSKVPAEPTTVPAIIMAGFRSSKNPRMRGQAGERRYTERSPLGGMSAPPISVVSK